MNNSTIKLVLLRHGESTWNLENRFTGWTDVDLTPRGVGEAREAGRLLEEGGYRFDVAHTSLLKRAIRTLWLALDGLDQMWLPVYNTWRLNERHYGALQGLNKAETAAKFGEAQVKVWRRSYADPPPALTPDDERYPGHDARYAGLDKADLPLTESLKDTVARFLPYWHATIVPEIQAGQRVLIAAHGNSLRALVKHLDGMSETDIVELNIPTGVPLGYLHGQERFFQMDLQRRRPAGEIAELVGPAALKLDRAVRVHRFRSVAQRVWKKAPAEERDLIQSYTEGVNAGLAALGAPPFEYMALRLDPQPWKPEDTILVALAMYVTLQGDLGERESALGVMHDTLPPALFAFLTPSRTAAKSTPSRGSPFRGRR